MTQQREGARPRLPRGMTVLSAAAFCALVGCNVVDTPTPASGVRRPERFEEAPSGANSQTSLGHWWRSFRDPALDSLIDQALENNREIQAAGARIAEARAMAEGVKAQMGPNLGADAGFLGGPGNLRNNNRTYNFNTAHLGGITADWEIDLFGGRAYDAAAAEAYSLSVEERLRGARLIVVAELAEAYFQLRGLEGRLSVLDRSIRAFERLLDYVSARFHAGQAQQADILNARGQLEALRAKRPDLVFAIDASHRRLAVLTGRPPESAINIGRGKLATPPRAPSGQLPSDVLERRPDVRMRGLLVSAQLARLNSAKIDLLPRFKITFFGQDGRLEFNGIPGLQGTGGLIGLSAYLPLFTSGRIEANIAANDARLSEAVADYDQALLRALEQVENAYGRLAKLEQHGAELAKSVADGRQNERANSQLYEAGDRTLDQALKASLDAFEREDALLQNKMERAVAAAQLYVALGGEW